MNLHEHRAYQVTREIYCDIVGGAENAILDKVDGWEGWQKLLSHPESIKNFVYDEVMGFVSRNGSANKAVKFAGTDFIMNVIEHRLRKDGYLIAE